MALKESTTTRTNQLTQLATDIGTGAKIRLYSGTRAANVGTSIGASVMLVELTGNAGGFGTASAGVLTAAAITDGTAVAGSPTTATWFRIWKSDGTTAVVDGDISTSGADMNLNNTSIATGQVVGLSSWTITRANA